MYRPAFLFLSLLAWVDASYAARLDKSFCTGVNSYVTAKREQKAATSFCSSFLHLSPVYTTKTVTATTLVTKDSISNVTSTTLSTVTATQAATVTTIVANNVLTTASSTVTAVATDLVTTTISDTVTTVATMLSNFALLSSGSQQYGAIFDSVGGSGEGEYFNANDFDSAAKFNFAGTQLYYNGQYINTYAASSGNYYVVVNRPYAQFGYPTQCTLGVGSGPSGSCPIECGIPDGSFYEPASGNDVDNYGGAWGFQGTTDRFTVYAVGST